MVIRNWERTAVGLAVTVAFIGFIAYATVIHPKPDSIIGGAAFEALLLVLLARVWRAGALVADDRLVVRNVLRSYAVPWSRVVGFSPAWDDRRLYSVGVTTADGRRISCTALRPMTGWDLIHPPRFAERAAMSAAANRLAGEVDRRLATARLAGTGSATDRPEAARLSGGRDRPEAATPADAPSATDGSETARPAPGVPAA